MYMHTHTHSVTSFWWLATWSNTRKTPITSCIFSQLCNCLLVVAPNYFIQSLQKVQNYCKTHNTPIQQKLHWLPVTECTKLHACVFMLLMDLVFSVSINCKLSALHPICLTPLLSLAYSNPTIQIQDFIAFTLFPTLDFMQNSFPLDLRHCPDITALVDWA